MKILLTTLHVFYVISTPKQVEEESETVEQIRNATNGKLMTLFVMGIF